ncbi:MAG: sigma-70 family RNA polymerase sigma factor [Pseudomonadota bacterium]
MIAPPRVEDRSAPTELGAAYVSYLPKLKAALLKNFGSGPPDPEDIIQQAFQNLLERKDRSDIKDIHAFLWRTARNLTLAAKRKSVVHSKYDFEIEQLFFPQGGDNSTPESILSAREELKVINQTLKQMPPKRRRAFVLHKIEELTVSDVARRLNISRSPAQKHINKAMQNIAVALAHHKRDRQR